MTFFSGLSLEQVLLGGAVLVLLSVIASRLSDKFAVPALLFFIIIGMLAGVDGIGGIHFADHVFTQHFSIIALVLIIFSGGLDTSLKDIRSVFWPGVVLSTAGILLTAVLVGVIAVFVLNFSIVEGFLLGAIVSSTDAAAVFSILRSRRISLKGSLRPLLEFESGSNDPMAIFLTIVLIKVLQHDISPVDAFPLFFLEMTIGAALGWGIAKASLSLINWLKIESVGLYPAFTLSLVLLAYTGAEILNGNGILAVYIMGVMMGNAEFMHKKAVRQFYEGLAWLMQIAMFLLLGLVVVPHEIPAVLPQGLLIALGLMFIARPASVFLALTPFKIPFPRQVMVAWVGLRGAAPIILAMFPLLAGLPHATIIFNVVFIVVLASILVQGTSITVVSRFLKVDVPVKIRRKYPIEFEKTSGIDAELTELIVPYTSWVVGKAIIDIGVPADCLIVLISRDEKFVVPNGATVLESADVLLVLADDRDLIAMQKLLLQPRVESKH